MIDYSFIIPHKNTPDLLRKCIDSIPHREGVQIIIVDDNSDPGKVDFDHFPGVGEPFTEVYLTKEGRGAGYARNVGLSHAVGKWVVFADADDFFNPCIEQAMDEYLDSEAEVIFFKGNAIKLPDGSPSMRGELLNQEVEKALKNKDFSNLLLLSCPYLKFIRQEFLLKNRITFNETRWANDVAFSSRIAVCAGIVDASRSQIYCVTESSGSLVTHRSLESQVVRFEQEMESVRICRSRYPSSRLSYWFYYTWKNVYKINRIKAITLLPSSFFVCGTSFFKEMIKDMFSKKKMAKKWEHIRDINKEHRWSFLIYPSFWHMVIKGPRREIDPENYLTSRPDPGAGIGHQITNWHAGYYWAGAFGLRFCCCDFSMPDWQEFLGYNENEVSMNSLVNHGWRKVHLPLFAEKDTRAIARIRRIMSSYNGKKVVFVTEKDQPCRRQYKVIPFVRKKFFSSDIRKKDILPFDPECYNIVMHIRRGDIVSGQAGGDPNLMMRWLDNRYYTTVLDQVLPSVSTEKPIQIYVYSKGERNCFSEFETYPNMHFCLDSNPKQAFLAFVYADVLIIGKSSFSFIPALLNGNGVKICPRDYLREYPESEDWKLVDDNGLID